MSGKCFDWLITYIFLFFFLFFFFLIALAKVKWLRRKGISAVSGRYCLCQSTSGIMNLMEVAYYSCWVVRGRLTLGPRLYLLWVGLSYLLGVWGALSVKCQRGPEFLFLPLMGLDLCAIPILKWPCAAFWFSGKKKDIFSLYVGGT